jgi:hypothetical protein
MAPQLAKDKVAGLMTWGESLKPIGRFGGLTDVLTEEVARVIAEGFSNHFVGFLNGTGEKWMAPQLISSRNGEITIEFDHNALAKVLGDEGNAMKRSLYEVTAAKNGPIGVASVEAMFIIAESAEQAKLIAVHNGDFDPLELVLFVRMIGLMPDVEVKGE